MAAAPRHGRKIAVVNDWLLPYPLKTENSITIHELTPKREDGSERAPPCGYLVLSILISWKLSSTMPLMHAMMPHPRKVKHSWSAYSSRSLLSSVTISSIIAGELEVRNPIGGEFQVRRRIGWLPAALPCAQSRAGEFGVPLPADLEFYREMESHRPIEKKLFGPKLWRIAS